MADNTITISKKEYRKLLISDLKLNMLESAGVDNWDWYGDALNPEDEKSFSELKEEIEKEHKDI